MFVVHTRIPVDPEERARAEASARRLAEATREEPGVDAYDATIALDGDELQFLERFEDVDALEAHTETAHYEQFLEELPAYVDGEMETTRFDVSDSWSRTFGLDAL